MTCVLCGNDLRYGLHEVARTPVVRLQQALIEGKRRDATKLPGIGSLSWRETMALVDVVLGMFWTDTTQAEQQRGYSLFQKDCPGPQGPFTTVAMAISRFSLGLWRVGRMDQALRLPWTCWPAGSVASRTASLAT
jgi:hypothetical protein